MAKDQEYLDASRELIGKAYAELSEGDLRQASEKGWGATAQIIKAIGERRGDEHHSHQSIRRLAFAVSRERADGRISTLFRTASDLHTNWYENWDTAEMVETGLNDVQILLNILETVYDTSQS